MALQLLFAMDLRETLDLEEALELFLSSDAADPDKDAQAYFAFLVRGVWSHRVEIDNMVRTHATRWRPERMASADRAVVRLALFEGIVAREVTLAVCISEAVKLAKVYGSEESPRFVNGVLGRIVRALLPEEPQDALATGAESQRPIEEGGKPL
jgi:N utilization substance protein B